jgi:hypothetical protein
MTSSKLSILKRFFLSIYSSEFLIKHEYRLLVGKIFNSTLNLHRGHFGINVDWILYGGDTLFNLTWNKRMSISHPFPADGFLITSKYRVCKNISKCNDCLKNSCDNYKFSFCNYLWITFDVLC